MGKEIVYCFKCQRKILGHEFEKGSAFQVENNVCCSTCAVTVLETLPPKAKEQLLAKMFKATQGRQQSNTSAPSKPVTQRFIVPPSRPASVAPRGGSQGLLIGIAIAATALAVIIIVLTGGSSKPPPVVVTPPTPVPAPRPPAPAQPSAEEQRLAANAREALRKARDYAQANPKNADGQVKQWQSALIDAKGTGFEEEAKRELAKAELRLKDAAAQEIVDFEKGAKDACGRYEYAAVLDLVAKERARRSSPEWGASLDRVDRDLRESASRRFAELKEKAAAARAKNSKADMDALRAEVAKWNLPEYGPQLEAEFEIPWRPIFDGRTIECVSGGSRDYWRVVDGALMPVVDKNQAGQSRLEYGDGEFRYRFAMNGCSSVTLSVRQAATSCRVSMMKTQIQALGPAEHVVVFTCKGDRISATMDGKPWAVELPPAPLPKGRLQFNAPDGDFRIFAMEYRELP